MRNGIWKFSGMLVLVGAIGFSVVQLRTPAVSADGCPEQAYINDCPCQFQGGSYEPHGNPPRWYCTYRCTCVPTGGGEPFEIEREVEVYPNP